METLYQFCVILQPTEKDRKENDARAKVVVPPSDWILARSEQEVVMRATKQIPDDQMANADRMSVIVRPF